MTEAASVGAPISISAPPQASAPKETKEVAQPIPPNEAAITGAVNNPVENKGAGPAQGTPTEEQGKNLYAIA